MTLTFLAFEKLEIVGSWKRENQKEFVAETDDCIINIVPTTSVLSKGGVNDCFKFAKGSYVFTDGNVLIYDLKDLNSVNDATSLKI